MVARSLMRIGLIGLLFASSPGVSQAFTATAAPAANATVQEHPRDGGVIEGKISRVDYQHNVMTVDRTDITLMPSTQIQSADPGYHAITDLKPGLRVRVYTSQIAGKYIAQIITLK